MPELLLLDTSAAIALLDDGSERRERLLARIGDLRVGLAGHAAFEAYSALTRMRPPTRLSPARAAALLAREFPETRHPSGDAQAELLASLAERGIAGGAVYDALVALAAAHHDATLISFDRRATRVYGAVGARFEIL